MTALRGGAQVRRPLGGLACVGGRGGAGEGVQDGLQLFGDLDGEVAGEAGGAVAAPVQLQVPAALVFVFGLQQAVLVEQADQGVAAHRDLPGTFAPGVLQQGGLDEGPVLVDQCVGEGVDGGGDDGGVPFGHHPVPLRRRHAGQLRRHLSAGRGQPRAEGLRCRLPGPGLAEVDAQQLDQQPRQRPAPQLHRQRPTGGLVQQRVVDRRETPLHRFQPGQYLHQVVRPRVGQVGVERVGERVDGRVDPIQHTCEHVFEYTAGVRP